MQINTDKPYRIFAEVLEQEALNQFESAMQQPSELSNKTFATLKAEVDKCVLLCANCHQIEHLGAY